jgi:hypothetical protein
MSENPLRLLDANTVEFCAIMLELWAKNSSERSAAKDALRRAAADLRSLQEAGKQ